MQKRSIAARIVGRLDSTIGLRRSVVVIEKCRDGGFEFFDAKITPQRICLWSAWQNSVRSGLDRNCWLGQMDLPARAAGQALVSTIARIAAMSVTVRKARSVS